MEVKSVVLTGKHVRLEPMTEAHIPGLAEIGVGQTFWDYMLYGNIDSIDDMRNWVLDILSRAEKGTDLPFVVIQLASGRAAGATRYLNIMPADRGLDALYAVSRIRELATVADLATAVAEKLVRKSLREDDHRRIIAFRNILIHGYTDVDDRLVWDIVTSKLPLFRTEIEALVTDA